MALFFPSKTLPHISQNLGNGLVFTDFVLLDLVASVGLSSGSFCVPLISAALSPLLEIEAALDIVPDAAELALENGEVLFRLASLLFTQVVLVGRLLKPSEESPLWRP